MKNKSTLYCDITPTAEGADLVFYANNSLEAKAFSVCFDHGIVDLRLKVNLQEPSVLECTQEGFDGEDNEVSSGFLPSRSAD